MQTPKLDDKVSLGKLKKRLLKVIDHKTWEKTHSEKNLAGMLVRVSCELLDKITKPEMEDQIREDIVEALLLILYIAMAQNIDLAGEILKITNENENIYILPVIERKYLSV